MLEDKATIADKLKQTPTPLYFRFDSRFTDEDNLFVAKLIFDVSRNPWMTRIMFLQAQDREQYFNDTSLLRGFIEHNLIGEANYRVLTPENDNLMSTHEFLTAVLCSGGLLTFEFLFRILPFVNSLSPTLARRQDGKVITESVSDEENVKPSEMVPSEYLSGKALWNAASPTLRRLLDTLDDAVLQRASVRILSPSQAL